MNKNILILTVFGFVGCTTTKHYISTSRPHSTTTTAPVQNTAKQQPQAKATEVSKTTATNSVLPVVTVHSSAPMVAPTVPEPHPIQVAPAPEKTESTGGFFSFFQSKPEKAVEAKARSTVEYPVNSQKIGVMLPLTGKSAHLGQRALTAIRMGLGLSDPNPKFSIALFDTQGKPELAKIGVEKLLRDDNVIAIIGGLGAKDAQAISAQADFNRVPFVTFSQKSNLTEDSDYTFRNAVTPDMQVNHLTDFAFNKLQARRFAVLYPNDAYGVEFANKFWDHVLARGGQVVAAQTYDPKDTDLNIYIQKMVGTYYVEDRMDEYKARLKEMAQKKQKLQQAEANKPKKNSRENEVKESILPPIVDFDAVFVPDSGRALGQAIAFFKSNDVSGLTFLGTNLWNTPDLARKVGTHLDKKIYFVDAESNTTDNSSTDFFKRYVELHQEEPTLLEAQTFESAKIIKEVVLSGANHREALASEMRELGRRQGAFSEIYMNNEKEIVRPLTILSPVQPETKN